MISNCGHDENGRGRNGQAGDQTGTEYCVRSWWDFRQNVILRHPKPEVRAKIAELATLAANNNMIGYDQSQRLTFYQELKKVNWLPQIIKTACEADCSSSTAAILIAVGHLLGIEELKTLNPSLTTFNMRAALVNAGFKELQDTNHLRKQDYLLEGDIILNELSHVAINLTTGDKAVNLRYRAHVQDMGWQPEVKNGKMAGTTGKSKRLEAIIIDGELQFKYQVHCESYGDMPVKTNGQIAGTVGESKRIEAIKIDCEKKIMYRVHVQDIGWTNWCSNGQWAGTKGKSLRVEAIELMMA